MGAGDGAPSRHIHSGEENMPISRTELENLIERKGAESGVLSVYLEVDQSRAANLNRGFTAALKDRLRAIEQEV
jgi:hypothetical protein